MYINDTLSLTLTPALGYRVDQVTGTCGGTLNGHVFRTVSWIGRLVFAAGGLTLLIPGTVTDVIGLVLVSGMMALEYSLSKRQKAEPPLAA